LISGFSSFLPYPSFTALIISDKIGTSINGNAAPVKAPPIISTIGLLGKLSTFDGPYNSNDKTGTINAN